jgi:hypothetical protein
LLGDGDKRIEKVYEEYSKIFFTGPTIAVKAGKQYLVPAEEPNEPTEEEPLSLVLFEFPLPQFHQRDSIFFLFSLN